MTENCSNIVALSPNILFQLVMQDMGVLPEFLSFSTGKTVRLVPPIEGEKTITLDTEKKGVRFDICATDEDGTVYDIEMENKGKYLKNRLRYYQSMMNTNMLTKGNIYDKMKPTKILVVCSFDPCSESRYIYQVDKVYRHNPELLFRDGEEIILLNSKGKIGDIPEELKEFFLLINGISELEAANLKTAFARKVYRKMKEILNSEKYEEDTMWLQAELMETEYEALTAGRAEGMVAGRSEGLIAGRAEGMAAGKTEGMNDSMEVLRLYKSGHSKEDIASQTGVSLENVSKMIAIIE